MIGPDQADVPTTEVEDAHNRALWLVCTVRHDAAVACLKARDRAIEQVKPKPKE